MTAIASVPPRLGRRWLGAGLLGSAQRPAAGGLRRGARGSGLSGRRGHRGTALHHVRHLWHLCALRLQLWRAAGLPGRGPAAGVGLDRRRQHLAQQAGLPPARSPTALGKQTRPPRPCPRPGLAQAPAGRAWARAWPWRCRAATSAATAAAAAGLSAHAAGQPGRLALNALYLIASSACLERARGRFRLNLTSCAPRPHRP